MDNVTNNWFTPYTSFPLFHRLFYFISFLSAFTNFLILSRLILFLISILLIVMRRMVRTVGIEITVRPAPYNHSFTVPQVPFLTK
jgi:hypothetical protein